MRQRQSLTLQTDLLRDSHSIVMALPPMCANSKAGSIERISVAARDTTASVSAMLKKLRLQVLLTAKDYTQITAIHSIDFCHVLNTVKMVNEHLEGFKVLLG
jgi:DNA relaxase NicK